MAAKELTGDRLTDEQQRLVRENIGLVALHLKRHVGNLSQPRRDREWEDLFQEGCLGLARAAAAHRPERGIPFPAFALPRIHNAVSKALQTKFSSVYVPPNRSASRRGTGDRKHDEFRADPKVYGLSEEMELGLVDPRARRSPSQRAGTVGERVRDKYERAVRTAQRILTGQPSTRGDRGKLVRILVEERLLVPHSESRTALRQVARDTRSSYSRVADCEKQLAAMIRRTLDADPQVRELQRLARSDPLGADVPIDAEIEHGLMLAESDELLRRYHKADPVGRAWMLHRVLKLSQADIEDVLRNRFVRLSNKTRQRLLEDAAAPSARESSTARKRRRRKRKHHSPAREDK